MSDVGLGGYFCDSEEAQAAILSAAELVGLEAVILGEFVVYTGAAHLVEAINEVVDEIAAGVVEVEAAPAPPLTWKPNPEVD